MTEVKIHRKKYSPKYIEHAKAVVKAFEDLKAATEELDRRVIAAGYRQRNALITHVYSNYNSHEELFESKGAWEDLVFSQNVHKALLKFLLPFRELDGNFPQYAEMLFEFDHLLNVAVENEEYEIAQILKYWRDKFSSKAISCPLI